MATNTAGTAARELHTQQVHYLRMTVNFATPGIANGVPFPNLLPAGAQILSTMLHITTAFAGGTPLISIGQNGPTYNDMMLTTDNAPASAVAVNIATGANLNFAADTNAYVKITNVGTGTAGVATAIIFYVPNNDA